MLAVAAIYWGKPVLVPITIAVLLTFLLNPVVNQLHRWGLRRSVAVCLVVLCVFTMVGMIAYALGRQVSMLASELPQYKDNISRKISEFRTVGRSRALERLEKTFRDIIGEIERQDVLGEERKEEHARSDGGKKVEERPVPVVVKGERTPGKLLPLALGSVMEWLVAAAMVIVLVGFMLLRLQDLRNRMLRLIGYSRLSTTTKALDEAGGRISRYLLTQSLINASYGLAISIGLFCIGLPYVVLLGFVAGVTRFIPYVGPPIGAALPIALSLALFHGWMATVLVIVLIASLEAITSMVLEPLLYGQSAGVSEVALLIAIVFWTWIWGPVGLALATPLTVCLVVLCKYIPELEFVEILLGDADVVDAPLIYYQRLLARDTSEATEIVQNFLKTRPPELIYDDLFIPALHWAKRDSSRGKLDSEEQRLILQTTRELLDVFAAPPVGPSSASESPAPQSATRRLRVVCCPGRDSANELGLQMLSRVLDPHRFELKVLSAEMLLSEMVATVHIEQPDVVCVGAVMPDPVPTTRHICKRLRECFPAIKIVACTWGAQEPGRKPDAPLCSDADFTGNTLLETRNHLLSLLPVLSQGGARPVEDLPHSASIRPRMA